MKIFDFRFLTDLHILGWFEHDFTIFTKCLSVGLSTRVCDTNFVAALEQEVMGRIVLH